MKYFAPLLLALVACTSVDPDSEVAQGGKVMALQEKFDRFDYNADGRISRGEFQVGIGEAGVTGVSEADLDKMMKHYDVNDDGAISVWESERAIDLPLPGQE